jgi:hypothetical protein
MVSGRAFVLLTYVVPGALVVVMLALGVLSPWIRISDLVFRLLVLLSLCSTLTFLLIERLALELLVREDGQGKVLGAFFDVESLRLAAINTLAGANPESPEDRVLLVTTIPGHAAEKKGLFVYNRSDTASHADVQQKIRDKIVAEPNWRVRQIINITSLDELESFRLFMGSVDAAPAYEVRAYSTRQSLPVAAPLVIANRHVLLGTEDSTAYRLTKEYGSSWIFEPCLTWANAIRRVQHPGFSLVRARSSLKDAATLSGQPGISMICGMRPHLRCAPVGEQTRRVSKTSCES